MFTTDNRYIQISCMAFFEQLLAINKNTESIFFKFARGVFPHSVRARSVLLTYPVTVQQETATARMSAGKKFVKSKKTEARRKEEAALAQIKSLKISMKF